MKKLIAIMLSAMLMAGCSTGTTTLDPETSRSIENQKYQEQYIRDFSVRSEVIEEMNNKYEQFKSGETELVNVVIAARAQVLNLKASIQYIRENRDYPASELTKLTTIQSFLGYFENISDEETLAEAMEEFNREFN